MPSTDTKTSTAHLTRRASGYVLTRGMNRSWAQVFTGVREDETPEEAIRRFTREQFDYYFESIFSFELNQPYPWEGDWTLFSLETDENGRLHITCGPELRTDENVPFLKDLSKREADDLRRAYHEMSETETLEYLEEDFGHFMPHDYTEKRLDYMWWDLMEGLVCNSSMELVRPDEIGALTDNHTLMTDEIDRTDQGEVKSFGRVYHYSSYQLRDPIMELLKSGEIILDVA